jgi:hypothetical protein
MPGDSYIAGRIYMNTDSDYRLPGYPKSAFFPPCEFASEAALNYYRQKTDQEIKDMLNDDWCDLDGDRFVISREFYGMPADGDTRVKVI